MKPIDYDRTSQAFQLGKLIGVLQAAKAIGSEPISPDTVRRLRVEVAAKILKRASILGKAKHARSYDVAQRYGLALKDRLIKHKQHIQARRMGLEESVEKLRVVLVSHSVEDQDHSSQPRNVAEVTRFHLETSTPVELSVLRERISHAIGFQSLSEMEKAGVKIETPSPEASHRVFSVTFALPQSKFTLSSSQITSLLRSATGATRLTKVPAADLANFRRRIPAYFGLKGGRWHLSTPEKTELGCCCCGVKEPETSTHQPSGVSAARPTWSSIPDDTEWHLKQMRVKEAWGIKPSSGGKSQGEGILIAHPDTGWREHEEYDQSQLMFDLARNVIENRDGKDATRHGTLTIPPARFETHGTGTGGVMISAEANGHTHVSDVPFDKMIATSSNVQLTGIAPKAKLAPIRCADGVVLLMDTNIHKAVQHAIQIKAHVISISLGGILDSDFERLIDKAIFDHNIIVVASAGQIVNWGNNSVIEPADFTNVIAVAGSTPAATPWDGSCRGPKVAVSAPARGVWFPNFFLEGTPGIYWGEGTSFSAAQVAAVAALWLAHWGRDNLLAHYHDVPLAHVFRHLLRKTAWRPKNWNNLFGAGIVDAYALLQEPLPDRSEIVSPTETDEFNLFDAFSDWLDLGGALASQVWDAAMGVGGAVGDFFGEMLNLSVLIGGLAVVGAMAEGAAGSIAGWADEQAAGLWSMVDGSLHAVGNAWDTIIEGGDEAVDAVGDVIEEGGDMMEDLGDAAAETWNQAADFVAGLF
jgi:Subtilase family